MNPLTGAADEAWISTPALRVPARGRKRSLADALADAQVRLGAGAAALLVTAVAVRRDRVGRCEAAAFRAVNGLPSSLYPPAWAVMQLGTLGAAPAAAGVAWLAGDRELAGRLLAGGTGTWALSKVFKHVVRRPRPAALIPETRVRGREAAGLGYLSGHAGVAIALGAAAFPRVGRAGRAVTLTAAPVVGLTRIYVGAHVPLDVAGGAALGLVVEVEADVLGSGLRERFGSLGRYLVKAAAFDTRMRGPAALTGRTSKGWPGCCAHGFDVVAQPESFLVTKQDRLAPSEFTRARQWGTSTAGTST